MRLEGIDKTAWRILTVGYWICLTFALVSVEPWGTVGYPTDYGIQFDPTAPTPAFFIHILAFGLLAFLFLQCEIEDQAFWLGTLCFYAFFTEWLQGFVPGRYSNPYDFFGNILGLGLIWFWPLVRNRLGNATTPE